MSIARLPQRFISRRLLPWRCGGAFCTVTRGSHRIRRVEDSCCDSNNSFVIAFCPGLLALGHAVQKSGVGPSREKVGINKNLPEQRQIGPHASDEILFQGAAQSSNCLLPAFAV